MSSPLLAHNLGDYGSTLHWQAPGKGEGPKEEDLQKNAEEELVEELVIVEEGEVEEAFSEDESWGS